MEDLREEYEGIIEKYGGIENVPGTFLSHEDAAAWEAYVDKYVQTDTWGPMGEDELKNAEELLKKYGWL